MNFLPAFFRRGGARPARRWRVTGPFKGITGYDRVVRSIVPELRRLGLEVELQDLPHWSPTKRLEKLPADLIHSRQERLAELHLHFGMPPQVVCSPGCPNINYSMFEADRIPAPWVRATEKIDLVIVPTESSRQSWMAGGVPAEKVAICPEGADFDLFVPGLLPLELRTRDGRAASDFSCRCLNVAEFITRKNLAGLLRSWLRATRAGDDAVLILKTGFYTAGSRERYERMIHQLEDEVDRPFEKAAPVILCERQLSEAEMSRLYATASHYWSMSFGEGFDLPMVEAAACGLQLIAPAHSSYLHYLTPELAFLLPVEEVAPDIAEDPGLAAYFQDSKWWRPDEGVAVETIRAIIDRSIPEKQSARECIRAGCNWGRMASELIRIVQTHPAQLRSPWQRA